MKIISGNNCYVQMNDILYLLRNANSFPLRMYNDIIHKHDVETPLNAYIKIEDNEQKEYIKKCNSILDYSFLMSKTLEELDEFYDEIKRNSRSNCLYLFNNISEYQKDRRNSMMFKLSISEEILNRNYLLSQLKEIKLLKSGVSSIEYPHSNKELSLKN